MTTNLQYLAVAQRTRWFIGEVVHHNHCAYNATCSFCMWSNLKPLIQGATLVRLKVTETNPTQFLRLHDRSHSLERQGKHFLEPGMHDERFIIADEELVKLDTIIGMKRRNTKNVRCDFIDLAIHNNSPYNMTIT